MAAKSKVKRIVGETLGKCQLTPSQLRRLERMEEKTMVMLSSKARFERCRMNLRQTVTSADALVKGLDFKTLNSGILEQVQRQMKDLSNYMYELGFCSPSTGKWADVVGEKKASEQLHTFFFSLPSFPAVTVDGGSIRLRLPFKPFTMSYKGLEAGFVNMGCLISQSSTDYVLRTSICKMKPTLKCHEGTSYRLHPHSGPDGRMCEGEAGRLLNNARVRRDIISIYYIIEAWAKTYNHYGAYQFLENFTSAKGQRCPAAGCGKWMPKEEVDKLKGDGKKEECPRCHLLFCRECNLEKRQSRILFCPNCSTSGGTDMTTWCLHCIRNFRGVICPCGHLICDHKGYYCHRCGNYTCSSCSKEINKFWYCPVCYDGVKKQIEKKQ